MSRGSVSADCVFVFGASGTIGCKILCALKEHYPNVRVKAQLRDESKIKQLQKCLPHVEPVLLDLNNVESDCFRGATSLFLLSPYSVEMLTQVRQIVDAAKEAGVKHIVHLGVYQPNVKTMCNYVHWHRLCETYIEASGMSWTHLRPNMFYENLLNYNGMKSIQGDTLSFPMQPQVKQAWVSGADIGIVAAKTLVDYPAYSNQIIPITSSICTLSDIQSALQQTVPQLKNLKLSIPPIDEVCQQLVEQYHAEPTYIMGGFKFTVLESNEAGDLSSMPGAKEGLEVVRKIAGREPMTPAEWIGKQKWNEILQQ